MAQNRSLHPFLSLFLLVLLGALASSLPLLDSEAALETSRFGEPRPPRHGVVLLTWYVQKCVDNNMKALCDPQEGEYGFHLFQNYEGLLPEITDNRQYRYYSIGNLNSPNAENLPDEVRRYNNFKKWKSNMDRVLVKYNLNTRRIENIYASAHYKKHHTYIIGQNLVDSLRRRKASVCTGK